MQEPNTLTPTQKREQTQIIFIAAIAGICMVLSAAFPLITYLALSSAAFALFISLKQWTERANIAEPPTALVLDDPSKTITGVIIGLFGIFLLQMNPLSQIILCTAAGASLAAFFIHDCILKAQIAVDNALRDACQKGELDKIKALLALKASPFSQNNTGNNAFHFAMQSDQAEAVLNELRAVCLQEPLTLKDVFASMKQLFNDEIFQKWSELVVQLKKCIQENSKENRVSFYEASYNVVKGYYVPLQVIVNTTAQYLIEQLSYPKDILAANKAGQKPLDILNNGNFEPEKLTKMQKILTELAQSQSTQEQEEKNPDPSPIRFSPTNPQPNPTSLSYKPRPKVTPKETPKVKT